MNQTLKALLARKETQYKAIPFWSWNSTLDPDELVHQIDNMKTEGIGGFIMHARTGLADEYLGEKWFACIEACLKKAHEENMEAWIYDENGWPSGFVGGKLLENEAYHARFLEYAAGDYDSAAFAVFVEDETLGFRRIEAPVKNCTVYHHIYLRTSPANTDILNPEVVDAFIQETHEQYYARFPQSFGRELAGFFTDEPQYYRWATPYSPEAEREFMKNGMDIRDGLIWLFLQDERGFPFRSIYYSTMNRLYTENFYKKLYDWCNEHHCMLTGHSVEESSLSMQMLGGGAVMPSYEYEHIPGIDWLGRSNAGELSPKQVSSISAQLGKKCILTETFGCSGYDTTPQELRSIAESQFFHGVSRMCHHLYPYSIAAKGKIDHPPVFGPHSNWNEGFLIFNDYFTRLGSIISNTEEQVDIAVLHPMHDIWLSFLREDENKSAKEVDDAFLTLLDNLRKYGVKYHLLDETILASHGEVVGDSLKVGNCTYSILLIPKMKNLSQSTYNILRQYTGKLCLLARPSYLNGIKADIVLEGNLSFEDILKLPVPYFYCPDGGSFITARTGKIGDFLFIKNNSKHESHVSLHNVASSYASINLETLEAMHIRDDLILSANESLILLKTDFASPVSSVESCKEITEDFAVTGISDNYLLLDYASISKDGINFSQRRPIPALFEGLLRENYKGELTIKQVFTINQAMPLTFIMEKGNFISITINGTSLSFSKSQFDVNFIEADLSGLVKTGENEILYKLRFYQHDGVHFALFDPLATESLRNCLYYDTVLENCYLRGSFIVEPDFSLSLPKKLPTITSSLYQQGYPFFMGKLTIQGTLDFDGVGKAFLSIDGRYQMADIQINQKHTHILLFPEVEITSLIKPGKNHVTVTLSSSLRNLFGPHHLNTENDSLGVSPFDFQFIGSWGDKGKNPPQFTDNYKLVPFGADNLRLTIRK